MSAEKLDRILEILSKSLSTTDNQEARSGISCNDELNSTAYVYHVYTEKLEKLQSENSEFKKLMSELSDEEQDKLYDNIWDMARAEVIFITEDDEFCEEEEPWMWR